MFKINVKPNTAGRTFELMTDELEALMAVFVTAQNIATARVVFKMHGNMQPDLMGRARGEGICRWALKIRFIALEDAVNFKRDCGV